MKTVKLPARPWRVLFVQSHSGLGGAETALVNLLRFLPRDRVSPQVVCFEHGNGALVERLERNSVPVWRHAAGRLRNPGNTLRAIRWLAQKIAREDFDIVVSNGGHPHLYVRPASLWTRRPSVWWVHDLSFSEPLRSGPLGFVQSLVNADVFVANSEHTGRALHGHFEGSRTEVIEPGIDLAQVNQASSCRDTVRKAHGIHEADCVIGMFARLQAWKGQHVFLQAAAQLRSAASPREFWIVGGPTAHLDPGYEGNLRRLARELGLEERVRFFGPRNNALELMSACDAVVHASLRPEPYGLVIAEAMALGKPVVATGHGGAVEMIRDGEDGVLVEPDSPAALAEALHRIQQAPDQSRRLGEKARAHAAAHFTAFRTAEKFCALFDSLHAWATNGSRPGVPANGH